MNPVKIKGITPMCPPVYQYTGYNIRIQRNGVNCQRYLSTKGVGTLQQRMKSGLIEAISKYETVKQILSHPKSWKQNQLKPKAVAEILKLQFKIVTA